MADINWGYYFSTFAVPLISPAIAILGWVVVAKQTEKREQKKRESDVAREKKNKCENASGNLIAKISENINLIEELSYEYFTLDLNDGFSGKLETKLMGIFRITLRQFKKLNDIHKTGGFEEVNFSFQEKVIAKKEQVTKAPFQTNNRVKLTSSDEKLKDISKKCNDLIIQLQEIEILN